MASAPVPPSPAIGQAEDVPSTPAPRWECIPRIGSLSHVLAQIIVTVVCSADFDPLIIHQNASPPGLAGFVGGAKFGCRFSWQVEASPATTLTTLETRRLELMSEMSAEDWQERNEGQLHASPRAPARPVSICYSEERPWCAGPSLGHWL